MPRKSMGSAPTPKPCSNEITILSCVSLILEMEKGGDECGWKGIQSHPTPQATSQAFTRTLVRKLTRRSSSLMRRFFFKSTRTIPKRLREYDSRSLPRRSSFTMQCPGQEASVS